MPRFETYGLTLLALLLAFSLAPAATVTVTDAKDSKPVANAVVSLVPLERPADGTAAPAPAVIVQKDKAFAPEVTVVAVGTTVEFSNEEAKGKHHVYSISAAKKFEIPLHDPGNRKPVVFDKPGVVALGCNIHDWMRAYVVVVETPWFAQTTAGGAAEIAAPPAGRYRVDVWHPRLKKVDSREVTLPADNPLTFALPLEPEQRIRRGPTTAGGGYK